MILVDERIGSRELLAPLRKAGLECELSHLDFADLAFVGRGLGGHPLMIGVELKNLADLVQSMTTGRLPGHQLPGLLRTYDPDLTGHRVYLIVEGEWRTDRHGKLLRRGRRGVWTPMQGSPPASALRKRLLTLTTRAGVIVWPTLSRTDTVAFVADLYRFWSDASLDSHKSHLAIYNPDADRALLRTPSLAEHVAILLPGIGAEKAKAVAKRFRTVEAMLRAREADWLAIDGVGTKIARMAMAALRTKGRA